MTDRDPEADFAPGPQPLGIPPHILRKIVNGNRAVLGLPPQEPDHHQAACEAATLALAEARDRGEVGAHALAHAAVDAAAPHVAAAERERIRQASIKAIAGYVLTRRDGEAVGVTEFINDLLTEGTDHA